MHEPKRDGVTQRGVPFCTGVGLMQALSVIERLDELKHGRLRVFTGVEPLL
jgi:hypothetical protein